MIANPKLSSSVVQKGAILAVTLMEPGVVTAAVLERLIALISTSICGVDDNDGLSGMIVARFELLVTWMVQGPPPLEGHVDPLDSEPVRKPALWFPLLETVGFRDKVSVTPDGMFWKVN